MSCDNGRDREWLLGYLLDQGSKGDLKMRGEEDQWMDWRASLQHMLQIKWRGGDEDQGFSGILLFF